MEWHIDRNGISFDIDTDGACFFDNELTYLLLDMLYKYRDKICGSTVLDIGVGTGIMSVYTKHLGAKSVIGIDNNESARECSKRNGIPAINNDLCEGIDEKYDIIIGSLPMAEQKRCLSMIGKNMAEKTLYFITWSADEIFNDNRFNVIDRVEGIAWGCLVLSKKSDNNKRGQI